MKTLKSHSRVMLPFGFSVFTFILMLITFGPQPQVAQAQPFD